MAKLLFVDDDHFASQHYLRRLVEQGVDTTCVPGPDEALAALERESFDLVLTDIMMPPGAVFADKDTAEGLLTGILLANTIRERHPRVKIGAFSLAARDYQGGTFDFVLHKIKCTPTQLAETIVTLLNPRSHKPKVFIVHGHDRELLLETKDFVQNKLRYSEPIILSERASGGRTIVEKFEHYAGQADLVFVLMSPDDVGRAKSGPSKNSNRARQNVVFEYGYFLGAMNRIAGRVLVLHKGKLEIPSDVTGVVYIDVTDGILSVSEQIRVELNALGLPSTVT